MSHFIRVAFFLAMLSADISTTAQADTATLVSIPTPRGATSLTTRWLP
jgi:hypothetical protein